jgi:D-alanyl-D-alanine carboxypeptidase
MAATIRGHNRLLGSYEGTDGIKTGYINASGFNLVSSVRRGEKRLVGVVLGGRTGASRDAYMKKMLTEHFPKGTQRQE